MPRSKASPPARSHDQPQHDFPRAIGQPATSAFLAAGYTRMAQLARLSDAEMLKLHGVGPKAVRILRAAFAESKSNQAADAKTKN